MEFTEGTYLKYSIGETNCQVLVDALHATAPNSDVKTGKLAMEVARRTKCHCIVSTISRDTMDLNRPPNGKNNPAIIELRRTVRDILWTNDLITSTNKLKAPVLQLSLHGMKDRSTHDIELGTVCGKSCSPEILKWAQMQVEEWSSSVSGGCTPRVSVNRELSGDISKSYNRCGDSSNGFKGYGEGFNTIQIEIASWLRENHFEQLVQLVSNLVQRFNLIAPDLPP